MAENGDTPGGAMSDEAYKAYIVQKYGHIRGLAKTLLFFRKDSGKSGGDPGKKAADKNALREDTANYRRMLMEADQARRLLNRLYLQLLYAEKNRSFEDIPYAKIHHAVGSVCDVLNKMDSQYAAPCIERQKKDLDYIDF